MEDLQAILSLARQGPVPSTWRVFTKKRGTLACFFGGASGDPDPLVVFTPEGVIEYISERKPLSDIKFADLSEVRLRVNGSSEENELIWLDLYSLNGNTVHTNSGSRPHSRTMRRSFSVLSRPTASTKHFTEKRNIKRQG